MRLLEQCGCQVHVPQQTCCGQPAYNSGDRGSTQAIAQQVIAAFEAFDYVVAPSGSCAGMLKKHYPALFAEDSPWRARAEALAEKTYELVSFLVDVQNIPALDARFQGVVTYHDSCSGLRELGIKQQPRALLASIEGLQLAEMDDCEVCCGFGGTFCVKYPDISNHMVSAKVKSVEASGAQTLLAGDLGCLLNIAGKLQRLRSSVEVRHIAELLAGQSDRPKHPAIGRN